MRFGRSLALSVVLALFACGDSSTGTISLITGEETDTFSRDPVPVHIHVTATDTSGNTTTLIDSPLQQGGSTLSLADVDSSLYALVQVTAADAAGIVRVTGACLPVQFDALPDATLPIFVQRTGEMARMPSPYPDGRATPIVDVLYGQYIVETGGTSGADVQLYDLVAWSQTESPGPLPRVPLSIAISGLQLLAIDNTGATNVDLSAGDTNDVSIPEGPSISDIAGGATVYADDGTAYVIGATRTTGNPTAAVLIVSTAGALSFAALTAPRLGAGASWVEGRGLIVVGGSATAPGVEVLAPGATNAAALAYPPDATTGIGVATLDTTHVLAGGDPRAIDVTCAASCAAVPWATLPEPLVTARTFPLPGIAGQGLIVGDDAAGVTHVVRVAVGSATEVPLKIPRKGARPVALPTGAIAVVGGGDGTIESFFP